MLVSHWPMSSAKPPRGSLQVPVTNCMSRSRTSLSTSFTSCREGNDARTFITDFLRLVKDLHPRRLYGEFTAIWDTLRKKIKRYFLKFNYFIKSCTKSLFYCYLEGKKAQTEQTEQTVRLCISVPARTRWSVCCSWCSDDTQCFSASPASLLPACHTASPGLNTYTQTQRI